MIRLNRTGFTLIELLVTISIVAVLVGLLLPTLSHARSSAKSVATLADLKQVAISMELYIENSKGKYPFHKPGDFYLVGPPESPLGLISSNQDPWSLESLWPTLFHSVAPWRDNYVTWTGRTQTTGSTPWLDENDRWLLPAYRLSNSFTASPQTWMETGPARIRAVSRNEVRFPSSKVIMFDFTRPYLNTRHLNSPRRGVLLSDSSARIASDLNARAPVPNRLRSDSPPQNYHDTPKGILGSDL